VTLWACWFQIGFGLGSFGFCELLERRRYDDDRVSDDHSDEQRLPFNPPRLVEDLSEIHPEADTPRKIFQIWLARLKVASPQGQLSR
jgi:hypothetical protein